MNRRGIFKLFGAALVLPFLPKAKGDFTCHDIGLKTPTDFKRLWRGGTGTMRWDQCEISNLTYNGVSVAYQAKLDDIRNKDAIKFSNAMEDAFWQAPG